MTKRWRLTYPLSLILLGSACAGPARIQVQTREAADYDPPANDSTNDELIFSLRVHKITKAGEQLLREDEALHNGDQVYFSFQSSQQAYLYLVMDGPEGSHNVLFPDKDSQLAPAGCTMRVPRENSLYLAEPAGDEKVQVLASLRPIMDADHRRCEELGLSCDPTTQPAQPAVAPCYSASNQGQREGGLADFRTTRVKRSGIAGIRFSLRHTP